MGLGAAILTTEESNATKRQDIWETQPVEEEEGGGGGASSFC